MAKYKPSIKNNLKYILIIAGILGLIASFTLTQDSIKIAQNASYKPSCNLNPILSCGSVIKSKEGSSLGFPNPFIGLVAFSVLVTIGMAMVAGAKFKRWFWIGLEIGAILGIGFIHYLFISSVFSIHALCPYCMGVWVIVITTFWYVTLYNIDEGHIVLPKKLGPAYGWVRKHHLDLLFLWFLIIAGVILRHFWYYYGHYF
ncbi:MAG TPA: vitamin K epoxide reductase family protein [Candidatus Saccharimonadales bacterium]